MNARNAKEYGLARSWNHDKELAEKVGNECAKAESTKEAPRKSNPKGRPKYRLSLALHSVINYLKKKKRKGCWFFMGAF